MRRIAGLMAMSAAALLVIPTVPALAADKVITVPNDFVPGLSDTRATGHFEVVGGGLHVWTEGTTSSDKVAEYVATDTPLATVGEPNLNYSATIGSTPPGFQLVVDFDGNGTTDGILIGEPVYGNDWWLNNAATQFVKDGAPSHTGGSGSLNHGTLDEWRAAFTAARVLAIGFSLGSGVYGDGTIAAINFAGDRYTFTSPPPPGHFTGFYRPIDMPPVLNTVKAGSVVPVKFNVTDGHGDAVTDPALINIDVTKVNCASLDTSGPDAIEVTVDIKAPLRWGGDQFILNWKVPAPGCYVLEASAVHASIEAYFKSK